MTAPFVPTSSRRYAPPFEEGEAATRAQEGAPS